MAQIVIVDDEKDMLEIVKSYLESKGHSILTASEGNRGLELILNNQPDLAIVDIKIPGLGGFQILRQAKQKYPHLPIIVLTGYHDTEYENKALEGGACTILKKPIGLVQFEEAISKVLRSEGSG